MFWVASLCWRERDLEGNTTEILKGLKTGKATGLLQVPESIVVLVTRDESLFEVVLFCLCFFCFT